MPPSVPRESQRGLVDLFGEGRSSLPAWIEHEFFAIHTRLSDGNPNVWHLSSSKGTFQALVAAKSFDADHIQLLRNHDVRKTIAALRRNLADAGDGDRARDLKRQIAEVKAFDGALHDLSRRGWSAGGPANRTQDLSTLQKAGVLARIRPQPPSPAH